MYRLSLVQLDGPAVRNPAKSQLYWWIAVRITLLQPTIFCAVPKSTVQRLFLYSIWRRRRQLTLRRRQSTRILFLAASEKWDGKLVPSKTIPSNPKLLGGVKHLRNSNFFLAFFFRDRQNMAYLGFFAMTLLKTSRQILLNP